MGFGLTISPFLMMTKHMELLQIYRKETSSEAPNEHMHITNISFKDNATYRAYEYDVKK